MRTECLAGALDDRVGGVRAVTKRGRRALLRGEPHVEAWMRVLSTGLPLSPRRGGGD